MKPKGLYIHVPFCVKKCPYCDFYSETELSLTEAYTQAVIRNIVQREIFADTVYFGGGTPSLLSAEQVKNILSSVNIAPNSEITMECNPNTVSEKYLTDILNAGVNRLSFGIQSLNDSELKALGRIHDSETAANAVNLAYKVGFRNISGDIMLCTSGQTMASLKKTTEEMCALPLTHISAYLLKIEPDTPFGRNDDIYDFLPDEDETAEMYLFTVRELKKHGFEQYEISNFAKKGHEAVHNTKYWRCEEYYGIGPSAHSYLNGVRKACPKNLSDFISAKTQPELITDENAGTSEEKAMLALRLTKEGINLRDYPDDILKRAEPLIKARFLKKENSRLMLTAEGCLVSNEIICRLII
ncbi:MAG: radical SAM family heme chaperone HemW [Oscillospiraceae bacterium]|nr:radical SAM family heme chaperone HemW [Oscillospiraceae bacterium]